MVLLYLTGSLTRSTYILTSGYHLFKLITLLTELYIYMVLPVVKYKKNTQASIPFLFYSQTNCNFSNCIFFHVKTWTILHIAPRTTIWYEASMEGLALAQVPTRVAKPRFEVRGSANLLTFVFKFQAKTTKSLHVVANSFSG